MSYITGLGGAAFAILMWVYIAVCYIVNIVQLFKCDFEPSYKDEIIHAIGLFVPPLSGVTVWF